MGDLRPGGPDSRRATAVTAPDAASGRSRDPVGLVTELVAAAEPGLAAEQIRAVVTAVAGGRATSRRLASALAGRPAVLADGRSPAPRAVGDLLLALRQGARSVSPPCCARCGEPLRSSSAAARTGLRHPTGSAPPCAGCGCRPGSSRDRAGQSAMRSMPGGGRPRSGHRDLRHRRRAGAWPAGTPSPPAVRGSAPRPSYQRQLAWAWKTDPVAGGATSPPVRRSRGWSKRCTSPGWPGSSVLPAPAVTGWCASTSRSMACGSAGPASRTRALSSAHAAEPAASPSPAMTRGRCAPTASSPTRRTWRPAPAAGAAAGSSGGPRTGRCAPAASRCRC